MSKKFTIESDTYNAMQELFFHYNVAGFYGVPSLYYTICSESTICSDSLIMREGVIINA